MEVLLGLLTIESMSGYDLGLTVRGSVGHFWNESYGQIYPNLRKLANDGLVRCKTERQKGKPDRRIYSITDKGRERLHKWLTVPPQPEIPRNELLLKLFFGTQASPRSPYRVCKKHGGERARITPSFKQVEQEEIARNQKYPDAPYWKMAAHFGQLELEAHLRWAEETLAELRKLARKQPDRAESRKGKNYGGR